MAYSRVVKIGKEDCSDGLCELWIPDGSKIVEEMDGLHDGKRIKAIWKNTIRGGRYTSPEIYKYLEQNVWEFKTRKGLRVLSWDRGGRSPILLVCWARKPKKKELRELIRRVRLTGEDFEAFRGR